MYAKHNSNASNTKNSGDDDGDDAVTAADAATGLSCRRSFCSHWHGDLCGVCSSAFCLVSFLCVCVCCRSFWDIVFLCDALAPLAP